MECLLWRALYIHHVFFMYNNISDRLVENGCALKIQPPFRRVQAIQLPLRLEVLGHELLILCAN